MFKKKLNSILYLCITILIILTTIIFAIKIYYLTYKPSNNENFYTFNKNWRYIADDNIFSYTNLPFDVSKRKTIILKNTLPNITKNQYLYMYHNNYSYEIYVDNSKIFSNIGVNKNLKTFHYTGNGYNEIFLPKDYQNKSIEIKIIFPNNFHIGKIFPPIITNGILFTKHLFLKNVFTIIEIIFIILISILLITLFFMIKNKSTSKYDPKFLLNIGIALLYSSFIFLVNNKFINYILPFSNTIIIILYSISPVIILSIDNFFQIIFSEKTKILKILVILNTIYILTRIVLDSNYILYYFDFSFIYYYIFTFYICISIFSIMIKIKNIRKKENNSCKNEMFILIFIIFEMIIDAILFTTNEISYSNEFGVITILSSSIFLYIHTILIVNTNVAEQNKLEYYKKLSTTDTMTGLYNKSSFMKACSMINILLENSNSIPAIIKFDIDNTKIINENFGYNYGDDAIITTAKLLKEIFSKAEIYRLGGDEFACIYSNIKSEKYIKQKIFDFKEKICEIRQDKYYPYNISIGYAIYNDFDYSIKDTSDRADISLYNEKINILNMRN